MYHGRGSGADRLDDRGWPPRFDEPRLKVCLLTRVTCGIAGGAADRRRAVLSERPVSSAFWLMFHKEKLLVSINFDTSRLFQDVTTWGGGGQQ